MVRFQIRRVVRQQGVGGGVRFVETVAGELFHQVEDLVGLFRRQAIFRRTGAEDLAVLGHLFGLLFTHGAAQHVGAAQRVAADDLRHLHHLLLIHHDAVGFGQNRFRARVGIIEAFAVLALAKIGNQVHRARTIQGHQRDNVFETVGTRIFQHALHAARLKLEHGHSLGLGQQVVGRLVVQWQGSQVEIGLRGIELLDVAHGAVENRQRGQAQKVELHQADGFHVILVVLRHDARVAALRVQRAEIRQLARGDQHAPGVHADIARDAFHLLRQLQQLLDLFLVFQALLEQRLFLDGIGDRHGFARFERDQLGNAVAEVIAEIHYAAHVADRPLGRHGTEGGDLRDRLLAIQILDVLNDAVAPFLAKVDIEVGHRDAFGIQEALEQQVVLQWIEVGNEQRIRHQRTRTRTTARADGHAVFLGPLDKLGHDEEVAREFHVANRVRLEFQTRFVARPFLFTALGIGIQL